MEKILEKLVDILKLSPRYFFLPILLITAFALFAPNDWLHFLSIISLVVEYRPFLGGAFLVSAVFVLVDAVYSFGSWLRSSIQDTRRRDQQRESARQRLHNLTEDEKDLLRAYVEQGSRTQYFPVEDGVVRGLEVAGIISIPGGSMVGSLLTGVAYNIKDWAWDYLRSHPELLNSNRRPGERPYEPRFQHRW